MKRRFFVAGTAAAVAAGFVSRCTKKKSGTVTGAKRQTFTWRLVMSIPKTLPIWGPGMLAFADNVAKASDGALKIKVYGANELVPAFGTFDAVKAGQVEMAHSAAYYWQGKIPAAPFFTAVPFGMNALGMRSWLALGGGQELWDELYAPHGVMALPAGNTGMQMGGWFNKEIKSINDFKGLKMRIPGLGGKVLDAAGAKPMLVPGGEIFTNLSTGVIDATEWVGPFHDYTMGFHKVAKYYYYPGWHEPGPVLELMINKNSWNKLPIHLQQIVRSCIAETDRNIYAEWLAKDAEFLAKIKGTTKIKLMPFPKDVLSNLSELAEKVQNQVADTSPLARKIYNSFQSFQKQFDEHQKLTEIAYMQAKFS